MTVLDTHTHFHDPTWEGGLVWPKPGEDHHRTCLPETYREEVGDGPVIAIETSPRRLDDDRLAAIARSDEMVVAYVNNLQPLQEGYEERLESANRDPKWRGLRLRPIEAYDLASTHLMRALALLEGKGHVELGIRDFARIHELRVLCEALPQIRFALTHCGHPRLDGPGNRARYEQLAGLENLHIKLSPPQTADFMDETVRRQLAKHINCLREQIGSERLMYGSNWPVSTVAGPFQHWLRDLFGAEAELIMRDNAMGFYRLG